jgi:hypothetical protein
VCGTSDFEIGWGYVKQVEIVGDDRWSRRRLLTADSRCPLCWRSHRMEPGTVRVGSASGAASTSTPSAKRIVAVP